MKIRTFALFIGVAISLAGQTRGRVPVAFVKCPSDGQTGPIPAPERPSQRIELDPAVASKLALYAAGTGQVLAPRGWDCFGVAGSGGGSILVTPRAVSADELSKGIDGPFVESQFSDGETMGRYAVGKVIARLFPERMAFVWNIIDSDLGRPSDFPVGPYKTDRLLRRTDRLVEFETPPNFDGLANMNGDVKKTDLPIRGVVMLLGDTPDLLSVTVRLAADQRSLAPIILSASERDILNDRK